MNGQRDIERVLEHWLLDGSNSMPDRLFEAVLDRVERVPQRRLARLTLRWTEMKPRIRLYTLAAAGLVVALVGLYLFNRLSPNANVGASPSPPPTPTAAAGAAMPAALEGLWLGSPRELQGLDADAGLALTFQPDGVLIVKQSANDPSNRIRSAVAGAGADRVSFSTERGDSDCREGDAGTYTWSISRDDQTLTMAAATGGDACPARQAAVVGSWELVDCPTPDDNCLGTISAGTHASQFFDPKIGPGDTWTPRYAAITYTVPDGWANVEDWPDFYRLAPASEGDNPTSFIFFARDIVLSSRADLCSGDQDPDAGTSAEAIARALKAPGLVVSTPEPRTIGGLASFRMDVSLGSAATPCSYSEGLPHQELLTDRSVAEGFALGIQAEEHARLYLIDVEPDRAIAVIIHAPTRAVFEAFVDEASAIVESVVVTP